MTLAHESRPQAGASTADALATWATEFQPSGDDLALADRSLKDTVAVMVAAKDHPLRPLFEQLDEAGRLAATAHVLDFDDLHMPSTAHISAICISAALASHGDARAYLAGAGVMARLGTALGWHHYRAGWHATCTAGAPAAAGAAARAKGLDAAQIATAIALAIPAAGGVQRAFGTAAKALQVGFAADAGVRAATLAAAGATADPEAVDEWIGLVNGDPANLETDAPTIPGGLAIKLYPCCYALQRPLAALAALEPRPQPETVDAIKITTPASALKPLIRSRPTTGLEGKFSLEYAVAAFLLDGRVNFDTFSDDAVRRPEAQRLIERVEVETVDAGDGLLAGEMTIEINGNTVATIDRPPGAPARPPSKQELQAKLAMCGAGEVAALTWDSARDYLSSL